MGQGGFGAGGIQNGLNPGEFFSNKFNIRNVVCSFNNVVKRMMALEPKTIERFL